MNLKNQSPLQHATEGRITINPERIKRMTAIKVLLTRAISQEKKGWKNDDGGNEPKLDGLIDEEVPLGNSNYPGGIYSFNIECQEFCDF